MFDLDFNRPGIQVLCHPQYQHLVTEITSKLSSYLDDHFVLFSSGTTGGDLKGYALSKAALFANARAVNEHFELTNADVWGLSLPIYHVGGLSVLARAHLLGNRVVDLRKWDPELWMKKLDEVTITTVVPTQVFDLVQKNLRAPKNLRYLVVGGDFLSTTLEKKALDLGWPIIRTFGMSEVSSQLASTKRPGSTGLQILPLHEVKTDESHLLRVKSPALFTLEFRMGKTFGVKLLNDLSDSEGFYVTKDRAMVQDGLLKHLGRMGDEVKISGHLVNLLHLKDLLARVALKDYEFVIEEDERKGKKLVLLTLEDDLQKLEEIKKIILPHKITEVRRLAAFPRTDLGKIKK
jgi:O-succinylbenzoic acid--CoA ligase